MENILNSVKLISDNLGIILALLTVLAGIIEKSKITWKPISGCFRWMGRNINKELSDKINNLGTKVESLEITVDSNRKKELKILISDFASDLRAGLPKSETQ